MDWRDVASRNGGGGWFFIRVWGRSDRVESRRRDSKHRYKPVPIIINDERVVVARLLHLALLDQSVESVLD